MPSYRHLRLGLLVVGLFTAALVGHPRSMLAASGVEFKLPSGPKYPSGLTLHVDARGIDSNGYRPVRLTVSTWPPNKALTADRQVRVVLRTGRMGTWRNSRVSQVIEIPEGSTTATATMLMPQLSVWTSFSIETYEGGEKLLDLCQDQMSWSNPNGWYWNEAKPAFLFLDSHAPPRDEKNALVQAFETSQTDPTPTYDLPDVRTLQQLFTDENQQRLNNQRIVKGRASGQRPAPADPTISDTALLALLSNHNRAQIMSPVELPPRWLELSQYDVTVISLADLTSLRDNQPRQFATLRDWLSTGPLLIVYGVGEKFAELAALEKLLDLPELETGDDTNAFARGWTRPSAASYAAATNSPFNEGPQTLDPSGAAPPPTASEQPPAEPPFVHRRAFSGCVLAIAADKPFPGKSLDWNWIFKAVPENHWQWSNRTGISLGQNNGDYWKLLVPGVGRAPVKSFLVLVTIFAVIIGPLNYLLLARTRRLYLVLLTVPLGAILVTAGLFGFAIVADGFGTRLRIRSFAELDQQTGRAAVHSWQSYYAAVAPSAGLQFPDDTAVFPFLADSNSSSSEKSTLLVWDKQQNLRSGFITARAPTQFVATRATTTEARVLINQSATDAPPKIQNKLGATIRLLVLRDKQGQYFTSESLPADGQRELQVIDLPNAQKALQKLAKAVEPLEPEGYDAGYQNDSLLAIFGMRRWRYGSDLSSGEMSQSLLETSLDTIENPNADRPPLLPGSYIAVLEHSPLVVTGVGPAREEQSLHVLRGRY